MLASSGEIGEPWGVPDTVSVTTPSTSTPALSHARRSLSMSRSDTRSATNPIRASCEICPKQSVKSASSTHSAPRLASVRTA